jgi:hypothetical protein
MHESDHLEKARRIEASLAHCRSEDYEMRIEGAMLAGTHYANLALHRLGLTAETWDIIHADFLTGMDRTRFALLEGGLLAALEELETLRPPWVRGDAVGGPQAGERAIELLAAIRDAALATKPGRMPIIQYRPWEEEK